MQPHTVCDKKAQLTKYMEHAAFDQGLALQLANHLKAPCYALSELKAENLYHAVKAEMARPMKK